MNTSPSFPPRYTHNKYRARHVSRFNDERDKKSADPTSIFKTESLIEEIWIERSRSSRDRRERSHGNSSDRVYRRCGKRGGEEGSARSHSRVSTATRVCVSLALPDCDVVGPRCATRVSALTSRKRLTLAPVWRGAKWGMRRGETIVHPSCPRSPSLHVLVHLRHPRGERRTRLPQCYTTALAPLCTHRPRGHPLHVGARVE